jgi:hypothetical protein
MPSYITNDLEAALSNVLLALVLRSLPLVRYRTVSSLACKAGQGCRQHSAICTYAIFLNCLPTLDFMCVVGVSRLSIKDLKVEVDRFLNHHIHLTSQGKLVPMLWHHHIGLFQSLLPLCFNLTFG